MDDDSEYKDGDMVWVKLSYCWWPGEVMAGDRLTEEFLSTLKRRPLAVVKFFDEDSYEFVKNTNFIYKYNCNRKHEFLRKGLEQYRAKNKHMEKFPADVMHAERATGGDPNIVNSNDFLQPQKRESYAGIFGDKTKGRASAGKKVVSPSKIIPVIIPTKKHEVRILAQASSSTGLSAGSRNLSSSLGSASSLHSPPIPVAGLSSVDVTNSSTSSSSPSQIYHCYKCGFETSRQNVIVLHTKYCRAVPLNIPSVKVAKPVKPAPTTPEKIEQDATLKESPSKLVVSPPKTEIEEKIEKIVEGEELVEVIQVVESKPTRSYANRTPRAAVATAKATPKIDRRRNRGKGQEAAAPVEAETDEKVVVLMEVTEEKDETEKQEEAVKVEAEVEVEVETKKVEDSIEKDDKDSKVKGELKNELLADWSEDEQDDQEDSVKEDESPKHEEPDKADRAEKAAVSAASSLETSLDKSVECSPQLASPVSCGTTIKYRNIPKKQKREFIEVTNDQPVVPASTIEKSSSESSISTTMATCGGDTPTASDKTLTSNESFTERPISAKQRILDRATRGSSKSVSSDETKAEPLIKSVTLESQSTTDDDSKKETSCFDFQEDEEEEVVLNKSPRRSLSNRRDTALELNSSLPDSAKEQEEQERAKKDAELKTEIESLLREESIPSLPELPKVPKVPSPGPSSSSAVETTPRLKEEIDRNRTLPPKERGKRIFKTRNKIIENEAIALEQSKAIVMDFVKKSHEEELAELLEQQRAKAKLCSESPTTTNDDSQESIVSNEPARFENSEFAAIKSKRTKISQSENLLTAPDKTDLAQESSVSSTNETKVTETESLPVSISKDQLALDSLTAGPTPKGRKGRQRKSAAPVVEKPVEEVPEPEPEQQSRVEDATPKSRKKRGGELQNLDLTALDMPRSRRGRSVKAEEPVIVQEEAAQVIEEPVVASTPSERHRKSKRATKEEEPQKEQLPKEKKVEEQQPGVEVPAAVAQEEVAQVIEEPVVASIPSERHRKSKRATKEEEPQKEQLSKEIKGEEQQPGVEVPAAVVQEEAAKVIEEPVVASTLSERHRKSKRATKEEEPLKEQLPKEEKVEEQQSVVEVPAAVVQEEAAQVIEELVVASTPSERHRKSKRAKKEEEPLKEQPPKEEKVEEQQPGVEVPAAVVQEEAAQVIEELVVASTPSERHRKSKRAKKEEESLKEQPPKEKIIDEQQPVVEVPTAIVEEPKEELKIPKSKRSKQLLQRSADSTAEIVPEISEPAVPTTEKDEPAAPVEPEPVPVLKQQPIKMIIKSKGRKSNSELLYEPTVVSPEPKEDEVKDKLPKSPKSSKRKRTPVEEPVEPLLVETPSVDATPEQSTSIKSLKSKRSKLRNEPPKANDKIPEETPLNNVVSAGPSATDLQIAEALIHLPDVTPPKPVVQVQELVEIKPNSSSPTPTTTVATAKTINPRKRHLQTLMGSPELAEQLQLPKPVETVTIPEKKKRETVEVISLAPVSIVLDESAVTESANAAQVDDDKFDIDNIPIVMDDSELLDDSTISTTTSNQKTTEETVQQIPAAKPITKKLVIVKNSNGSAKNVSPKESPPREISTPAPKKKLGIKSTTITIKPPVDQLAPKATRSPAHSPPIRGAQLVQAGSGGQIVITSKGTVLTTQSPTTTSAKSSRTGAPKTLVTPAKGESIVSSVSSVSTISSSTFKSSPTPSTPTSRRSSSETPIKPPVKICVQSQEVLHPSTKSRSKPIDLAVSQKKTPSSSTSPPKKVLMKKHSDASSPSGGKPLFSTSKGAPITPQPATSSAVSRGKKAHKVIKISPQKLKEFTRLGMVEDKGQGKVLTASGMKKFRQEQYMLQQQKPQPEESKKTPRADSVDEEPSTSTPTPPPPSEALAEVVVAAAADSSVKEIPAVPMETEELTEEAITASFTESLERPSSPAAVMEAGPSEPSSTEENEADAAFKEQEAESSTPLRPDEKEVSTPPVDEASEPSESAPVLAVAEATSEATESGSNVQESSQLIAVPAENFGGPSNLFYLCSVREEGFVPVNNELLYLDSSNQLVALPEHASVEDIVNQAEVLEIPAGSEQATMVTATATVDGEGSIETGQQNILLNTQDGQQIILDQQSLMALAAGGDTSQLLTPDGQQILLQGSAQELLAALAVSQSGLGIVAAEGTQIIVAPESLIDLQDPPLPGEIIQVNPNTTVETNAVLTKPPIMSAVEVPTKNGNAAEASASSSEQRPLEPASTNLNESLAAVIGVSGNPNVPTSLELPITVTNPVIAKTTTSKINPIYPPTTAISAIVLDPAAAATGTVIGLPTVAQTDSLKAIKSIWD